jgi:TrmH family RNA methyltransferase
MKYIYSATHSLIKNTVRLHKSSYRKEVKLFLAEGFRVIETLLQTMKLYQLFITEDYIERIIMWSSLDPIILDKIIIAPPTLIKKMSKNVTPAGIVAVFVLPDQPQPSQLGPGLVLAEISDPGNMGTLIRTAAACRITSVVVVGGVDPWSPKVIQASAGTVALVKIFQVSWEALISYKKA